MKRDGNNMARRGMAEIKLSKISFYLHLTQVLIVYKLINKISFYTSLRNVKNVN